VKYYVLVVLSSIWEYLIDLSKNKKTTIIITTHYIEETRQADTVSVGYATSHS
jgi:ABC-type multidrug transport system ATPase subunit